MSKSKKYIHRELAEGRWQQLTLMEQLGNVGSEVHRSIMWHEKNDLPHFQNAFDRALELFDLTLADPRWKGRRKEIARSREVFCDIFYGDNQYGTDPQSLDDYFMQFAVAARLKRETR